MVNLLSAAGVIVGVGDWRQEKGSGNYGLFRVAQPDDKELLEIMRTGGRKAQFAALETPGFYDKESQDLIQWFGETLAARGAKAGKSTDEETEKPKRRKAA